jgi:tetratricopeptide (TPR) repeat protein
MKKLIVIILYFSPLLWRGAGGEVSAQDQHLIDSLQLQLKNHNARKLELGKNAPVLYDTTKANMLYEISKIYRGSDPTKAIDYASQSLIIAQQINFKKGIGNAYFALGVSFTQKGEFAQALDVLDKSLKIQKEIDDKMGIATTRNCIGLVYYSLGNYPLSLQNHLLALKIREDINDKNGIAASYNNIAIVYMMQKSYDKALKYLYDALAINKETGNKQYQSSNLEGIGLIYSYQGNFNEAIKQVSASIKILNEIGAIFYLSEAYIALGEGYEGLKNYSQAIKSYNEALKVNHKLNDKEGQARSNAGIGTVYIKLKEYKLASEFLNKGLTQAKEIGNLETIKKCYKSLAALDSLEDNLKLCLFHYTQYIAIRDTIYNEENTNRTTALQLQYDTEKKEKQIALLTKESKLQQTDLQRQNTTRNALMVACILITLLAGIIFNRYRIKQKANAEIETTLQHLKNTQEQLVEHEKLASMGKFTNDVAKEIEAPVKNINQLSIANRALILNIKKNGSLTDVESLKNNLLQIFNYGKEADTVVKKVLTETRKIQG